MPVHPSLDFLDAKPSTSPGPHPQSPPVPPPAPLFPLGESIPRALPGPYPLLPPRSQHRHFLCPTPVRRDPKGLLRWEPTAAHWPWRPCPLPLAQRAPLYSSSMKSSPPPWLPDAPARPAPGGPGWEEWGGRPDPRGLDRGSTGYACGAGLRPLRRFRWLLPPCLSLSEPVRGRLGSRRECGGVWAAAPPRPGKMVAAGGVGEVEVVRRRHVAAPAEDGPRRPQGAGGPAGSGGPGRGQWWARGLGVGSGG